MMLLPRIKSPHKELQDFKKRCWFSIKISISVSKTLLSNQHCTPFKFIICWTQTCCSSEVSDNFCFTHFYVFINTPPFPLPCLDYHYFFVDSTRHLLKSKKNKSKQNKANQTKSNQEKPDQPNQSNQIQRNQNQSNQNQPNKTITTKHRPNQPKLNQLNQQKPQN
jgi:hypothetical protein